MALTDKDINKMMKVFATKGEVRSIVEEEVKEMKEVSKKTLKIVEGFVSRVDKEELTNAARDAQLTRHDGWIKHIAKETKVSLKH